MQAPQSSAERRSFEVRGIVQGVGFRPFVYRIASERGLAGHVLNDGHGVSIEAQGDTAALDSFAAALRDEAPALASVASVASTPARLEPGAAGFTVAPSLRSAGPAVVPADAATCDDCLRELFDAGDRRFRYPFINCTQCGPRYTIVRELPYDRANTTMSGFAMCAACRGEYEDPNDRRFHAEPIACAQCGPALSMPVGQAAALLRSGAIVAIKGLGGYHLACDATNDQVVARLRQRKQRDGKPFAVMTSDPEALAHVDDDEWLLLTATQAPIVLVPRRAGAPVAASVAPSTAELGLMLPYTPLHHLLLGDVGRPLVMTSGNRSDEPIVVDDDEVRVGLGGIADALLSHDRPIHRRCDDSVLRRGVPVRRSRGYVPARVSIPVHAAEPLLAVGAELKSTFCVARDGDAYLSPHLGDLASAASYQSYVREIPRYLRLLGVEPIVVAHDLHPDYLSTKWALEQERQLVAVQHHHAHAAACLAENGVSQAALALVFDGTGYGPDGTMWGGELLRCDLASFERVAHFRPIPLPGGAAAIREPWRVAAAALELAGRPVPFERWRAVRQSLRVNAPLSSGVGRLFDAVAAIVGLRESVSYEGQAAIELEQLAGSVPAEAYACQISGEGQIDSLDLVRQAHDDLAAGRAGEQVAAAFHEGVAAAAVQACEQAAQPRTVALSGGSFQNLRLLHSVEHRLRVAGFTVITHRQVPPNDAGISYGQAAVAAQRLRAD